MISLSNGVTFPAHSYLPPDKDAGVESDLKVQFFSQPVDHYNKTDERRWEQAFLMLDQYFQPGGPVFYELGGEAEMSDFISRRSLSYNLTRIFNGLLIKIEHRYYGNNRSIPTEDLSTPNLQWLTVAQTLEDYANFIMNSNLSLPKQNGSALPFNTKWITVGASYSGSLSAWMRLEYPDLVYAAHASSAPIYAEESFWEYGRAVDVGLPKIPGGTKICADNWSRAIDLFDGHVMNSNNSKLKEDFGVYESMDIRDFAGASTVFGSYVQYGGYSGEKVNKVDLVCSGNTLPAFAQEHPTDEELFSDYIAFFKTVYPNETVLKKELDTYWQIKNMKLDDTSRLWGWQYCSEFGFFQIGSPLTRPFYSRLLDTKYYNWACEMFYGIKPDFEHINRKYLDFGIINQINNTVFTNGEIDPWHWLSINQDTVNVESPNSVIFIGNGSHCEDFYTPRNNSNFNLVEAYQKIISSWQKIINP